MKGFEVFFFEQGGAGDGDGFVAGTHQGHAVGDALGDEEGFGWLELLQYGEVEDVAPATFGELEPRMIALPQVAGFAWNGILIMATATVTWALALKHGGTAKISNLAYITPFVSLVYTYFMLGEAIVLSSFVGLGFIIAGVIIQMERSPKSDKTESAA